MRHLLGPITFFNNPTIKNTDSTVLEIVSYKELRESLYPAHDWVRIQRVVTPQAFSSPKTAKVS